MNSNQLKITQALKVFSANESDCFHLQLKQACLVILQDDVNKHGLGFFFRETEKDSVAKSQAFGDLVAYVKKNPSQIKLIGLNSLCKVVTQAFKTHKIPIAKEVNRNESFEVFVFLKDGKTRISVEESQPVQTGPKPPYKVMVVDDSSTIRQLLTQVIGSDPELNVVAAISNPLEVEKNIAIFKPDVITLDIHMPEMDGIQLLKILIPKYHIPTVMITSISMDEGPMVLSALEHGAIDYIQKPSFKELAAMTVLINEKIKNAAQAKVTIKKSVTSSKKLVNAGPIDSSKIVAIGSSTGGTEALKEILVNLPEQIPPILIVQHIPAVFSLAFAKRMDSLCKFEVKEAEDGDLVLPNRVLIAPGGKQMTLSKKNDILKVVIDDSPPVNRHKPSVDYLFFKVAELLKDKVVGIILTGMGADGAKGLLELKKQGAKTIAQSEKTCVVFGMPREAIKIGAADEVIDLEDIAEKMLHLIAR